MARIRRDQTLRYAWPLLVGAVVVAVLGTLGVLSPLDRAADALIPRVLRGSVRDHAPVLVGIDDAALTALGPLPWSPEVWTRVSERLAATGVSEVDVVEPIDRLVSPGEDGSGGTRLRAPAVVWPGRGVAYPGDPPTPFVAWQAVLDLPARDGVIRGVGASSVPGEAVLCAWARCPDADPDATRLTVEPSGLPTVRLSALLDGQAARLVPGTRVLLGVTAPSWARYVAVGDDATLQTWPEAVALATASLRAHGPVPALASWLEGALLLLVTLVTGAAAWREGLARTDAWVAVAPVGVGLAAASLVATDVVALPLATLIGAALVGPAIAVQSSRTMMLRFLRRSSLDLARADLGRSWDPALDPSPEGLLRCLASLTWNHCPTDHMALVVVEGARMRLVGGFGVGESDLQPEVLDPAAIADLARRDHANSVLRDPGLAAHVVPVRQGRVVVGYWLVVWKLGAAAPEVEVLVDLARWVETRLSVPDPGRSFLRLEDEIVALRGAIARSAEARTWQGRILGGMHLALATADRTGAIIYENEAWRRFFAQTRLGTPRSVREVAFQLAGERGISARMRRLFVDGQRLVLPAPSPYDDGVVVITPVGQGADGFVAWVVTRDDQPSHSIVPVARVDATGQRRLGRVGPGAGAEPRDEGGGPSGPSAG